MAATTDRPTTSSGKIKVNFTLDPDAVDLLGQMAQGQRALGGFLSELIREEWARRQAGNLVARVQRLEAELQELRAGKGEP